MTVFKYKLELKDTQTIQMPLAAEILTVQMQDKVPCIWVICNPYNDKVGRTIEIIGTGNDMPNGDRKYIGTIQDIEYPLVWHVFERIY